MKRFTRDSLRFPTKEFDLLKEGTISLVIVAVLVLVVAGIWGAPYRPAVTNEAVSKTMPVVIEQTALGDLNGSGSIASYGPPYNNGWHGNAGSIQSLYGFSPQTWWGIPYPVNTAQDDVIGPLTMLAQASGNQALSQAIHTYATASYTQQQSWDQNLQNALNHATVANGNVMVAPGQYGPVATMMQYELQLARSGLLSGALNHETNNGVYRYNVQNDLLFLQGQALHKIANQLDMSGEQWGINHDESAFPGPWWLTPYTFFYQIPPWNTSSAGDQAAAYTVGLLFFLLILVPFIPGLNKLPRALPVHRIIWRDWYNRLEKNRLCETCALRASCEKEFKDTRTPVASKNVTPNCYQQKEPAASVRSPLHA